MKARLLAIWWLLFAIVLWPGAVFMIVRECGLKGSAAAVVSIVLIVGMISYVMDRVLRWVK